LAELLPDASTSGRQLTIANDHSALKATTARFLAAAGPVAVSLGIDRLSTALLINDFSVIPGSKLYYALAERESIWNAANALFGKLGWGPAVPIVPGLPVGSHIVPRREAIKNWLGWMTAEVQRVSPGRHCGIERLVLHHNTYARTCASIVVWLVAARESKEFRFTTLDLSPTASFVQLIDKRVGAFPGKLWIPLCALLQQQLALWITVVEINPHVLAFRNEFNVPKESECFRIVLGDAAEFVAEADQTFDVILMDAFDREGFASSVCNREFYDHLKRLLGGQGMVVANLAGDNKERAAHLRMLRRAFGESTLSIPVGFDDNDIAIAFGDMGYMPNWERVFERAVKLSDLVDLDFQQYARKLMSHN
jgi:hypothetical protein